METKIFMGAIMLALALTLATVGITTGMTVIQQSVPKAYADPTCGNGFHWKDDTHGCVGN